MSYISQFAYYNDSANYGSYQYVSLEDIVNNFMLMETGNRSLINSEERFKVLYHSKRCIQELTYDATREVKVLQLNIADDLRFILPSDYVNWVRLSLYKDGVVRSLNENIQINYATQYLQATNGTIVFDIDGNVVYVDPSQINDDRLNSKLQTMYLNPDNPDDTFNGSWGWLWEGNWYFSYSIGARFGLHTETANFNPTFRIDSKQGVINFSSDMANELCILEYISDGMANGDDTLVSVNKLFEKYVYAYVKYEILNSKLGVQEYVVNRARKERTALWRNARIRISNIHPAKIFQAARGVDQIIK